jgi:hypothetical protein
MIFVARLPTHLDPLRRISQRLYPRPRGDAPLGNAPAEASDEKPVTPPFPRRSRGDADAGAYIQQEPEPRCSNQEGGSHAPHRIECLSSSYNAQQAKHDHIAQAPISSRSRP